MSESAASAPNGPSIRETLDRFVEGFNVNDLDHVMTFFADDADYRPGDGTEYRGKASIRAAFEPQFRGAFGEMHFAVDDWIVDEQARKATIRWICHHDITGDKGRGIPLVSRWLYLLVYGQRVGWYGLDVFHFDENGKIKGKYSYANTKRPQLRRDLARSC